MRRQYAVDVQRNKRSGKHQRQAAWLRQRSAATASRARIRASMARCSGKSVAACVNIRRRNNLRAAAGGVAASSPAMAWRRKRRRGIGEWQKRGTASALAQRWNNGMETAWRMAISMAAAAWHGAASRYRQRRKSAAHKSENIEKKSCQQRGSSSVWRNGVNQ
jgi:hypothetical protein